MVLAHIDHKVPPSDLTVSHSCILTRVRNFPSIEGRICLLEESVDTGAITEESQSSNLPKAIVCHVGHCILNIGAQCLEDCLAMIRQGGGNSDKTFPVFCLFWLDIFVRDYVVGIRSHPVEHGSTNESVLAYKWSRETKVCNIVVSIGGICNCSINLVVVCSVAQVWMVYTAYLILEDRCVIAMSCKPCTISRV